MPEKENICEDAMKAVCKMASEPLMISSFQGASHFTVNFNIKSYFHNIVLYVFPYQHCMYTHCFLLRLLVPVYKLPYH